MRYTKEEIEDLVEKWESQGIKVPPIVADWLEMHAIIEKVKKLAFEYFGTGIDVGVN